MTQYFVESQEELQAAADKVVAGDGIVLLPGYYAGSVMFRHTTVVSLRVASWGEIAARSVSTGERENE